MSRREKSENAKSAYLGRQWAVLGLLSLGLVLLGARAAYLQLVATDYLQAQGNARYQRIAQTPATRGKILDRNGEPLAVSTPVDSVWAHPATALKEGHSWPQLARLLGTRSRKLLKLLQDNAEREFVYVKRHLPPTTAEQVMALNIPGIDLHREYRRYYPAGPVFGHIIGFTNIDDEGQEGLELAFNQRLNGTPGRTRVLRDRVGHVVERIEQINPAVPGQDLRISLDARLQYLAYRHLKAAAREHRARAASVVVLDARTGGVLAMVNEPSFNPNNRGDLSGYRFRNRAVTDVFEPGSTIKPFTISMALQQGSAVPDTRIDTSPGVLQIGRDRVRDTHDYGLLTVSRVIVKSSNVGAAKIALALPAQRLVDALRRVGFGQATDVGIPGEVAGSLPERRRWRPIEHATLAFGYGLSATALQLARAYTVFATGGVLLPTAVVPTDAAPRGIRVFRPEVVRQVAAMLELAVSDQGTGRAARVPRYRVAGKTGTVHKLINGAYAEDRYLSIFAGYAPATDPRLVMVVVIDDPRGDEYYGGAVAAPVFSAVMSGALRLLNIAPDLPPRTQQTVAAADGA